MEAVMKYLKPKRFSALILTPIMVLTMICTAYSQNAAEMEESLFIRLGGLEQISLVVNDFVDVFIQDPVILSNPVVKERKTADTAPYVKFQVTTMVCQVTGGPCQYTGLDMREAHRGLNVSKREWDRMVELFVGTLEKHQVSAEASEELLHIMGTTKDDIVVSGNR